MPPGKGGSAPHFLFKKDLARRPVSEANRRFSGGSWAGDKAPWTVEKKRALFLTNRDRLGRSTGLSAALRPPGYGAVLFPRFKRAGAEFTGRAETFRVSGRDLLLPPGKSRQKLA